jgi:hypothetical protein
MTVPRWIPVLAVGLFLAAAITLAILWSRGALRHPSEDARSPGAPAACAPLNPSGPPPADCPQAKPPTQRTP